MKLSDDDFTLFGLPQRFAVDAQALDRRWRDLQSQVHPDRFAADGASAQRLAVQWSVRVNEAYRRLRDPIARAASLCELRGAPIDAEHNTAMPRAFLTHQLAWREALEEAATLEAVQALDNEVALFESDAIAELQKLLDERDDAAAAAAQVRALMFVARFRADIDRRLDALGQ
jgi:molecular chaperone HscB